MAIVKMKQLTLLTFSKHTEILFKSLQQFGQLHLNKLSVESISEKEDLSFLTSYAATAQIDLTQMELDGLQFAVAQLAEYAARRKMKLSATKTSLTFAQLDDCALTFDHSAVVNKIKRTHAQITSIQAEFSKRKTENEMLRAWEKLDTSCTEFSLLGRATAMLGTVHKNNLSALLEESASNHSQLYLEVLDPNQDDVTLFVIALKDQLEPALTALKEMGFSRVTYQFDVPPLEMIQNNHARMTQIESERQALEQSLETMLPLYESLQIASDYFRTLLSRNLAMENLLNTHSTVVLEGWFPEEDTERIEALLHDVCGEEFAVFFRAVDKEDARIPVKLKNNRFVSAFEDITATYSTPKYNEIDPTPLLAPFYWLFFGFMFGDVAFGLFLIVGGLIALKKANLKPGMQRFMKFFFYLGFSAVMAGVVYDSLFGFSFLHWFGLSALLNTEKHIPLMLILAVGLGVVQIVFGLLVKGYALLKDGKVLDAVFDSLFWVITLLGGIAFLVSGFVSYPAGLEVVAKWSFFGGIIGLALTQGRHSPTIGGKIGTSLWELYGMTSYMGDLISYTRIVALGLSGTFIAFSFIKIASILPSNIIGFVASILIIMIGQGLNFAFGLLGAYVHAGRLQYVEFFGKFFDGGGRIFAPLKHQSQYVDIIDAD